MAGDIWLRMQDDSLHIGRGHERDVVLQAIRKGGGIWLDIHTLLVSDRAEGLAPLRRPGIDGTVTGSGVMKITSGTHL